MVECEARQHSDQMSCDRCHIAWDMNDSHPPACPRQVEEDRLARYVAERKAQLALFEANRYLNKANEGTEFERFIVRVGQRVIDAMLISAGIYVIAWLLSIFGVVSY